MAPEVKHPPRSKALSYANIDNSNQQTVGHMRMCESHGEGRGCGSGTRVSTMLQVKQNISPLSALPAIQHEVFINLHPISGLWARHRVSQERFTHLHAVRAHTLARMEQTHSNLMRESQNQREWKQGNIWIFIPDRCWGSQWVPVL